MFEPVYLDHNATTPLAPEVLEAMLPWLSAQYGNPSSRHEYGRAARRAVDEARQQVAAAVGAHPTEVIFTSGGSEANNLFLKGLAASLRPGLAVVGATEHPCVLKPARQLQGMGWRLKTLPVDGKGHLDHSALQSAITEKPQILSLMSANNETGVIQDVLAVATLSKPAGVWFHSDCVQVLGKLAMDFREMNRAGVHAITVSAHKARGPKGAAALIVDKRVELEALIAGGGHERGVRSGTENVAAIVGFGVAATRAKAHLETAPQHCAKLQERLEKGLLDMGAHVFGLGARRLSNTCYFAFADVDGETLVGKLDRAGFAVASGAACSSANPEPSHVLQAMGVQASLARGAVRVSVGEDNTDVQIDEFLLALRSTLGQLKQLTAIAV